MKIVIYNTEGKEVDTLTLPKDIFDVKINEDLIYQVVTAQQANRRQGTVQTKGRGEVRGGGKKPWRQKGTGRARVGSIRSPLWRGGGVTFGPTKEKVYKKKISKQMRRQALLMTLSAKAKNNLLVLLDQLKLEKIKTKIIADILKKLPCQNKSTLLVTPAYDKTIVLSTRNLPKVQIMPAKDLNALDVLSFKYLVMTAEAIKVIKETFLKQK
ncbi:MAG: 50S ribosomal protein L4 [Minisyncoccales bacterium]